MDNIDAVVNANITTKKISWLELIPKLLAVLIPFGVGLYFLFQLYTLINFNAAQIKAMSAEIKELRIEMHNLDAAKVDRHEFKDLDEKVSRQYALFNDRMLRDVDPMKTWIEFHKGWLDGSKFQK